jgi:hypothetical protein
MPRYAALLLAIDMALPSGRYNLHNGFLQFERRM